MFCTRLGCAAAVLATHLAFGQAPATRPASPNTAQASIDQREELKACLQDCRRTFSAVEEALRSIALAEQGEATDQTKNALVRTRGQLIEIRGQVTRSLQRLENLNSGTEAQPAWAGESWACAMHPQVRQDRPGNCPICDGTLRNTVAVRNGPVSGPRLASAERSATLPVLTAER